MLQTRRSRSLAIRHNAISQLMLQTHRSWSLAIRHHAVTRSDSSAQVALLSGRASCLRASPSLPLIATLGRSSPHAPAPSSFHLLSIKIEEPGGWHPCHSTHIMRAPSHAQAVRPTPLRLRCHLLAAVVLSHLHGHSTGCPAEETWRLLIRSDVTALRWARRHPSTPWPAPVCLAEAHAIFSPDLGRSRARIPSSAASLEQANPPSSSTSGPAQLQRRHGIQRTHLRSNRSPDQRL